MFKSTALAVVALCAAVIPARVHAQAAAPGIAVNVGAIRGRLADSASGAPIGTGSITVRRGTDTIVVAVVHPQADGAFRIDHLASGSYALSIRVLGFAP